uniref:Uncharacterized protein n=1 Tax=Anguilla anguilla TaxID=7936 RepID=A0A0E9RW49_ANGAN
MKERLKRRHTAFAPDCILRNTSPKYQYLRIMCTLLGGMTTTPRRRSATARERIQVVGRSVQLSKMSDRNDELEGFHTQ